MIRALVVDDHAPVRALVARALEALEWEVREAADARVALELAAAAPVDVLVTDVSLGGGESGLRLAVQVRAANPDVCVVYVSGHDPVTLRRIAAGEDLPVPEEAPRQTVLRKPFGLAELRAAVTGLLTRGVSTDLPVK